MEALHSAHASHYLQRQRRTAMHTCRFHAVFRGLPQVHYRKRVHNLRLHAHLVRGPALITLQFSKLDCAQSGARRPAHLPARSCTCFCPLAIVGGSALRACSLAQASRRLPHTRCTMCHKQGARQQHPIKPVPGSFGMGGTRLTLGRRRPRLPGTGKSDRKRELRVRVYFITRKLVLAGAGR